MLALDGKWSELEVLLLAIFVMIYSTALGIGICFRFGTILREAAK
jgi:hypothetical protein